MGVRVEALYGSDMARALPALAALRIEVFRDFPYLYDGTLEYEANYLERLAKARDAVIVGAFDVDEIVGCATALPLVEEHEEFIAPVRAHGLDPHKTFYLAESVLRRSWRGFGTGNRFFELREQHARSLGGFERALFCGVIRPENHPARPSDYRPLDGLWRKHGYAPINGLQANFSWRDVGDSGKTTKAMQFWMKNL